MLKLGGVMILIECNIEIWAVRDNGMVGVTETLRN